LPGTFKKGKPTGTITSSEVITEISLVQLKQLLGNGSYPVVIDLSSETYDIHDDGFALNCENVFKEIYLNNNSLNSISAFTHLSKLKILVLDDNNIVSMNCQGLHNLIHLSLKNNQLSSFYRIEEMKKLVYLDLSNNKLKSNLNEIGYLSSLKYLDLSNNPLISSPKEAKQYSSDTKLYLNSNDFSTLISDIGSGTKLEYFSCDKITNISQKQISTLALKFMHKLSFYNMKKISKQERSNKLIERYKNDIEIQIPVASPEPDDIIQIPLSNDSDESIKKIKKDKEMQALKSKNMKELKLMKDDLDSVFDAIFEADLNISTGNKKIEIETQEKEKEEEKEEEKEKEKEKEEEE